jgi:hypothetical protein
MLLVVTAAYFLIGRPGTVIDRIAVVSLELVDVDASASHLGDGFRDSLVMRLSRLDGLRVKTTAAPLETESNPGALARLLDPDYPSTVNYLVRANALLGRNDEAFEHFERGLAEGSLVVSWLRDPLLDEFRTDPRYAQLFRRIGLEP